jgi:hypothetical protein
MTRDARYVTTLALVAVLAAACSIVHDAEMKDGGRDSGRATSHVPDASTAPDGSTPDAMPLDASPRTDSGSDGSVPSSPIDPEAIYQIDECPLRPLDTTLEVRPGAPGPGACTRSADCTQRARGRCNGYERDGGVVDFPRCGYEECASNADCAAGERCECSFHGLLRCVHVGCERDGDCAPGQRCARTVLGCYEYALGDYLCTTPSDECLSHSDCSSAGLGNHCTVEGDRRVCISHTCD